MYSSLSLSLSFGVLVKGKMKGLDEESKFIPSILTIIVSGSLLHAFTYGTVLVSGIFINELANTTGASREDIIMSNGFYLSVFLGILLLIQLGRNFIYTHEGKVWMLAFAFWFGGNVASLYTYDNYELFSGLFIGLSASGGGMLFWLANIRIPLLIPENHSFFSGRLQLHYLCTGLIHTAPSIYHVIYPFFAERLLIENYIGSYWYENAKFLCITGTMAISLSCLIILSTKSSVLPFTKMKHVHVDYIEPFQMFLFFIGVLSFQAAWYFPYQHLKIVTDDGETITDGIETEQQEYFIHMMIGVGSIFGRLFTTFTVTLFPRSLWILMSLASMGMTAEIATWSFVHTYTEYMAWVSFYGCSSGVIYQCLMFGTIQVSLSAPETEKVKRLRSTMAFLSFAQFSGSLISIFILRYVYTTPSVDNLFVIISSSVSTGCFVLFTISYWCSKGTEHEILENSQIGNNHHHHGHHLAVIRVLSLRSS